MHVQVPHKAVNGQNQKYAAQSAAIKYKTTKSVVPVKSVIGSKQSRDTIKAGHITTPERQLGAGSGQADGSERQKVGIDGQSGQRVAGVLPDAFSKTTSPSTDVQTAVNKTRNGRRQRASRA